MNPEFLESMHYCIGILKHLSSSFICFDISIRVYRRRGSSAVIYAIAETAKANNLKPYDYFEYLLTEILKHMEE